MHARRRVLVLAAALAAGSAVAATAVGTDPFPAPAAVAGPNDVRLDVRASRFEPGDVVTRKVKQTVGQSIVAKSPEGKVLMEDHEDYTLSYEAVVRVAQVTSEGRPWRADVHFAAFTRDDGKSKDECLRGMTFEWVDARVRRIAGDGKISPKVQRWLDEELSWGLSADMKYDRVAALRPKAAVAVGASWDGDGGTIADHYAAWNPVVADRKAATARCTLESATPPAKAAAATVRVEAAFPLLGQVDYTTRERMDLGTGSGVRFVETCALRLDGRIHTGTSTARQTTTIRRDAPGGKMEGVQEFVTETTLTSGGEFPDLPPIQRR